ncbi:GIY-YIG nuclease family protein [Deinococcus sp.]|uniref:GIY-YIG nuclease family protein n=1 Tax=Deinococcus sp. TaxID=47478 RepID=UPI002869B1B1|nr:GIY-YIG nuclease family protein [Deinococcus sp.]
MTPLTPTSRPGIYSIAHVPSGRTFLGYSVNVDAILNRTRFELQTRTHRHVALQGDWTAPGPEAFVFGVLDILTVEPGGHRPRSPLTDDLKELLILWQEKLNLSPDCRY